MPAPVTGRSKTASCRVQLPLELPVPCHTVPPPHRSMGLPAAYRGAQGATLMQHSQWQLAYVSAAAGAQGPRPQRTQQCQVDAGALCPGGHFHRWREAGLPEALYAGGRLRCCNCLFTCRTQPPSSPLLLP